MNKLKFAALVLPLLIAACAGNQANSSSSSAPESTPTSAPTAEANSCQIDIVKGHTFVTAHGVVNGIKYTFLPNGTVEVRDTNTNLSQPADGRGKYHCDGNQLEVEQVANAGVWTFTPTSGKEFQITWPQGAPVTVEEE
jgi:hypothetical protein